MKPESATRSAASATLSPSARRGLELPLGLDP
jgi:hypothetical protein